MTAERPWQCWGLHAAKAFVVCLALFGAYQSIWSEPLTLSPKANAYPVSLHMDILEDPDRTLGISDVTEGAARERFKANTILNPNLGYPQASIWIRFELKNQHPTQSDFVLVCDYAFMDHFDLFERDAGVWRERLGGDQHPRDSWRDRQRTPHFNIQIPPGQTRTYFIRAQNEGSMQLPIRIEDPVSFQRRNQETYIFYGLVIGAFGIMQIYSLLYGAVLRSVTQLYYSLLLFGAALYITTQSGMGQMLLWGPANWFTNPMLLISAGIAGLGIGFFFPVYLALTPEQRFLRSAFHLIKAMGCMMLISPFILPYRIGSILTIPFAVFSCIGIIGANLYGTIQGNRQAFTGLISWSSGCIGFIIFALIFTGTLPLNLFTQNANIIGALGTVTLQALAIADQITYLQQQQIKAQEKHQIELEEKVRMRTASLQESRDEIRMLADLARRINETTDIDAVLASIFGFLRENYGLEAVLFLADSERRFLRPSYVSATSAASDRSFLATLQLPLTEEGGTVAETFRANQTDVYNSPDQYRSSFDALLAETLRVRNYAHIPLRVNDESIGVLSVTGHDRSMRMSRELVERVENFCTQISGAIQMTRLLQTAEESSKAAEEAARELSELNQFSELLNATLDLNAVFEKVTGFLARGAGIDTVWLLLVDEEKRELYTYWGSHPEAEWKSFLSPDLSATVANRGLRFLFNLRVPLNQQGGTLAQTYQRGRPFYIQDLSRIRERSVANTLDGELYSIAPLDLRIAASGKLRSLLQIPLLRESRVIGILNLARNRGHLHLDAEKVERIVAISRHAAGALFNALMMDRAEKEKAAAELARAETERLASLSRRVNQTNDLLEIVDQVLATFRSDFPVGRVLMVLVDERANELYGFHSIGLRDDDQKWFDDFRVKLEPDSGTLYRTYRKAKSLYLKRIPDVELGPVDAAIQRQLVWHGFLHIPLVLQSKTVGILITEPRAAEMYFTRETIQSMTRLGEEVAGAVRNARFLTEIQRERRVAEAARAETEQLAEFTKRINETTDIEVILDEIFAYVARTHSIMDMVLFVADHGRNMLKLLRASGSRAGSDFVSNIQIPLNEEGGLVFRAVQRGKPLYVNVTPRYRSLTELDRFLVERLNPKSFGLIPLRIHEQSIGLVAVDFGEETPDRAVRRSLERFCAQIAGAVYSASLLREVEKERSFAHAALEIAEAERGRSDALLKNILPDSVADELKREGRVAPLHYEQVSVLFTDFVGFTKATETMPPDALLAELDAFFTQFDEVVRRNGMEKLKTIGDAYMCAAGLPRKNATHALDACLTALELRAFMLQLASIRSEQSIPFWRLRIGIHTGPVTAGVIGTRKFAYDIWGDTVNTASRMESHGAPDEINVSAETYQHIKDFFDCEPRGAHEVKGKGIMELYFVKRIRPELSADEAGLLPNARFEEKRAEAAIGAR